MSPLPLKAVIIPIIKKDSDREPVSEAIAKLEAMAKQAGIRVKVSGPVSDASVILSVEEVLTKDTVD